MHLTDEQLNEYLDHESREREKIDAHLASCLDCAQRLAELQVLFGEIASLPEIALSHDLAAPIVRRIHGRASLPRSLRWTVVLQFAATITTLVFAAPFVVKFLSPYVFNLQAPSLIDLFLQVQAQWTAWLDLLSQLQLPGIPEVPVAEFSSVVILLITVGVSLMWLVGNGLLLKDQIK